MDKGVVLMIIGVDIGGSNIRAAQVTSNGKIKKMVTLLTEPEKSKKHTINNILSAIELVFNKSVTGIGIGIAGHIDKGIIYESPNIPKFKKVNLAKIVRDKFKRRVEIDNDANCFAMAEAKFGQGKGKRIVVGNIHGTGFGCGIIVDGKVLGGRDNNAGEFGMIYVGDGPRGVLEDFCSGRFIKARAKKYKLSKIKPAEVQELAMKGNKKAKTVYEEYAENIAYACSIITCAVNPDIIVLGGGTAKAFNVFGKHIRKYYKSYSFYKETSDTTIVASKLKEPGLLGAAGLVK